MIVSILQMMGFPKGKPDKVRAEESNAAKLKKAAAAAPEKKQLGTPAPKKDKVAKPVALAEEVKNIPAGKDAKAAKKDSKKAATDPGNIPAATQKVKPKSKEKDKKDPPTKENPPVAKEAKEAKAVQAPSKTAVQPVLAPLPIKKSVAKAVVAAVKPMAAALPALVSAAAKAARPSSRLAQITVPSMAQTVASTAAKSSYSQTPPSLAMAPVIPAIVKKDTKLANNWKSKPVAQLTDAELLAMPDAEYMNEVQLAAFRLKLSELKSGILSNAGETTEHLREESSVVPDPADRATIEEEHALELRTRDRERKLLKKIEQSIVRIDAGDYGYCDETGEPIGVGRLLARPTATLSLEAQQRRELKQKMFGD
jgi:DnaK suppressor protein